jgi:hypothetical protein
MFCFRASSRIAVDDAALVRRPDRSGGLAHEHDRALDRQRTGGEPALEVVAA